jgi:valyl-tRNA synthetase
MASTQDVRFADERIEMSRNFCNKIFNAARFVLLGVEDVQPRVSDATLADRWIESRLQAAAAEVGRQLEEYDFAEATRVLYRFVWNEFCDWYVEIAKSRLYGDDAEARRQVSGHLLHLLDSILRLLHPFIPFLTEELAALLPGEHGFLIEAPYPEGDDGARDMEAERKMEQLMETVVALRTLKNELRVPPRKEASAVLVSDDEQAVAVVEANSDLLQSLAATKLVESAASEDEATTAGSQSAVALVPGGKMLVPLEGLIDMEKEKERLEAAISRKKQEVLRSQGKLDNKKFVEKAPSRLVQEEREKLDLYRGELSELEQQFQRYFGA